MDCAGARPRVQDLGDTVWSSHGFGCASPGDNAESPNSKFRNLGSMSIYTYIYICIHIYIYHGLWDLILKPRPQCSRTCLMT